MPVPGTLGQYVSKSGGNAYHGSLYADFQNDALEAHQHRRRARSRAACPAGPASTRGMSTGCSAFRDFNADVGGYLKKDKAWWYGAYRSTEVEQRYPWLLDTAATLDGDGRHRQGHLPAVSTPEARRLPAARDLPSSRVTSPPARASRSRPAMRCQRLVFPVSVWKGEYNAAVTDALYVEARVGGYLSDCVATFKSTAPRIADVGANTVSGGAVAQERLIDRPQVNGSMSFLKTGWGGSHTFRIGGEYMNDRLVAPNAGYGNPCNCVSTLNNGVPTQVQILFGPERVEERSDDGGRFRGRHVAPHSPGHAVAGAAPGSLPADSSRAAGTGRADVRGDRPRPHLQQLGPARRHERRSHGRRQDCAETPLRKVLGLPGTQLHHGLQSESVRLVADLRSGPTMRTGTADGIRARKDD